MARQKDRGKADTQGYFRNVAVARFVLRKIFRIADEQARAKGLDPLAHQALIQVFGSEAQRLRVNQLAERLDIAPAFASTVVAGLVSDGYVIRTRDTEDQRVTWISLTNAAVALLIEIDEAVKFHVSYFTATVPDEERTRALETLKLYVGLA